MDKIPDLKTLTDQFATEGVQALVLAGSFAREDANYFSDVDLMRLIPPETQLSDDGSHFIGKRLINVSSYTPERAEAWFTEPGEAIATILGLRTAKPLFDPDNLFAAIQERACLFTWDDALREKAYHFVSGQMVGWVEEVLKGLSGLHLKHHGRLLNARFGLTWGLMNVVSHYYGILHSSDNQQFDEVMQFMGEDGAWSEMFRRASCIETCTLRQQVEAGLWLYTLTAKLVDDAIRDEHRSLIEYAFNAIDRYL